MVKVLNVGFVVADIVVADLLRIPEPGFIEYAPLGIRLRTGGHPSNISVDLMQMGMGHGEVAIAGKLGKDIFGDYIENYLRSKGVLTFFERSERSETSKSIALVVKGEDRRFITEPGANLELSFEFIADKIRGLKPKVFYQASGILGDYDYILREAFTLSKRVANSITLLDFIQPYGKGWDYLLGQLDNVDIIHCNGTELRALTNENDLIEGMKKLARAGPKIIFISEGEKGAKAYHRDLGILIEQDSFKVRTIDPTGAGDAFVAGIIFRLIKDNIEKVEDIDIDKLIDMLTYAQASGASGVPEIGATAGVTKENIEALIKTQGENVKKSTRISRFD